MPKKKKQKILIVAPEIFPQIKVGGLGQFIAGIVKALKKKRVKVELITPSSSVYGPLSWPETKFKFNFLAEKALKFCRHRNFWPDLVWAHDWSGVAVLNKFRNLPAKKFWTIHSPANESYYYDYFEETENDPIDWSDDFFDFQGLVENGLQLADRVNTVSPSYARELNTKHETRNMKHEIVGIANGINFDFWNPQKDNLLDFGLKDNNWPEFKKRNKIACQKIFGLPQRNVPLSCFVSRLSPQKGIDLFYQVLPKFMAQNAIQLIVVGQGRRKYHRFFNRLKEQFPTKVGLRLKADFDLPHQVFAGADFLILPSRAEPGGIVVQEAARYGTLPIVRLTGGLKDQVVDGINGLGFTSFLPYALEVKLHEALKLWPRPGIWQARKKARGKVRSWKAVTGEYLEWFNEKN